MLPFYGRRLSRNTKNYELDNLESFNYFFNNSISILKKKISTSKTKSLNLEIGFGTGENLIFQSKRCNDEIFIACDPFISGSLKLKKKIEDERLGNIFFTSLGYFELYNFIKTFFFRKIYILFPDPWPKKRHKKRRLINLEFVRTLKKITFVDSKVFVATDDHDYANQIRKSFLREKYFNQEFYSTEYDHFRNDILCPTKYCLRAMNLRNKIYFFIFKQN